MSLVNRFNQAMATFIERITSKYSYAFVYSYTVVSQNSKDNTLDLKAVIRNICPDLKGVKIIYDNQATRITVPTGATCFVFFVNGDPSQPRAFGFENDGGAVSPVARKGDEVTVLLPPLFFAGTINALPATGVMTSAPPQAIGTITGPCSTKVGVET